MRLSDFIVDRVELILQAWEVFARTVETPLPPMDAAGLRDHAKHILLNVASDMRTAQTERQQIDKSHGLGPAQPNETPAQTHALTRLGAGFSMDQMVSEYRALRSSVLRLWLHDPCTEADGYQVQDMIRFNEAIDQALVESIAAYSEAVEITRKTMLGVLGHDLRSPLGAILMAGDLLRQKEDADARERKLAAQICSSVNRANQLVNDLLDLARCNLGGGIPVNLESSEWIAVCETVVEELRTGFPDATIKFRSSGVGAGMFDPSRMAQVFSNLIGNAIRHGDRDQPIEVSLDGSADAVVLTVKNSGDLIPPHALPLIFNPGGRYSKYASGEKGPSAGLGLGLFIASEIVAGHKGRIDVTSSSDGGTVFRVCIPKTLVG
jgi:signal transduction histidine kinase